MGERESLNTESDVRHLIPIKGLRLITSQQAVGLGIKTEGPIFVSRSINRKQLCNHCGIEFSALVYGVDGVTRSQHLHEGFFQGGGIYYELLAPDNFRSANIYGWLARVEPKGVQITDLPQSSQGVPTGRSEEAVTLEIMSLCINSFCKDKFLDDGVVAYHSNWPGSLLPYHKECLPNNLSVEGRMLFKLEEGRPLFSQV